MNTVNLINKDFEDQERKNREKYGSRENDLISECYRKGKEIGDIWSLTNAKKYIDRFLSKSGKGGNLMDLLKATDYISRSYSVGKSYQEKNVEGVSQEMIDNLPKDISARKTVDKELHQQKLNDFVKDETCKKAGRPKKPTLEEIKENIDQQKLKQPRSIALFDSTKESEVFQRGYNDFPDFSRKEYDDPYKQSQYSEGFKTALQQIHARYENVNDKLS